MKMRLPILVFFGALLGCAAACFSFNDSASVYAASNVESPFNQFPLLHMAAVGAFVKPFPVIAPRAYLVADLDTGEIISEKNPNAKLPIASLTKLMTSTVVFENVDLEKSITIDKSMLDPYGFSPYLVAGKDFNLAQLLYPMLVESSNDAAQAASCFMGNGTTIKMMNEKARALNMNSTNYVDAHGLDPKNTSTVSDLFYLARYISKNHAKLLEVTKGNAVDGIGANPYSKMKNKNLVYDVPNFIGGKTGYIPESNYNGLFIFNLPVAGGPSRRIAIIVFGAQAKFKRRGYFNP